MAKRKKKRVPRNLMFPGNICLAGMKDRECNICEYWALCNATHNALSFKSYDRALEESLCDQCDYRDMCFIQDPDECESFTRS